MTEPINGDEVYTQKLVSQAKVRRFVSQYGRGYLSIGILGPDREPVDPDGNTVTLRLYFNPLDGTATDARGELVDTVTGTRDDVGKFSYDIGPTHTSQRGALTAEWSYSVNGVDFTFVDDMQILEQMPYYESLRDDTRLMVEQSSWFFADLFDSATGGPWLQENFQSHFTYDRMAFLLGQAVMKFNVLGMPLTQYGVTPNDQLIPDEYVQLLMWGTKLEIIRHLIASYTEIPDYPNTSTTYTNRRDYADRWRAALNDEKPDYDNAVKLAKRKLLRLGRGSILVAGGIYGSAGRSIMFGGMQSALVRSMRFYPAAPSVSWGAQATGGAW